MFCVSQPDKNMTSECQWPRQKCNYLKIQKSLKPLRGSSVLRVWQMKLRSNKLWVN